MSTRPRLTDAVENKILVWIRSGAFPHVAAAAEGVPQEVFEQWLTWGTRKSPPPIARYRRFVEHIREAAGIGRVRAEIKILEKDPKFWLLSGPGKDAPQSPGWTSAVKPASARGAAEISPLADPQLAALIAALLAALIPFPEARKAAVAALQEVSAPGVES